MGPTVYHRFERKDNGTIRPEGTFHSTNDASWFAAVIDIPSVLPIGAGKDSTVARSIPIFRDRFIWVPVSVGQLGISAANVVEGCLLCTMNVYPVPEFRHCPACCLEWTVSCSRKCKLYPFMILWKNIVSLKTIDKDNYAPDVDIKIALNQHLFLHCVCEVGVI